jgi:hypothetical protein
MNKLRPKYKSSNFGALVRGKYVKRLVASSNVVVLDPEVAELFPNAASVNAALKSLAEIAKRAGSRRGVILLSARERCWFRLVIECTYGSEAADFCCVREWPAELRSGVGTAVDGSGARPSLD